jgi:hypothetical protein
MHRVPAASRRGGASARRWLAEAGNRAVRHRGGVPWYRSRLPARWHFCRPQSVELRHVRTLDGRWALFARCWCACGAVTDYEGRWQGRNSRRHVRRQHGDPVGSCDTDAARFGRRRTAASGLRAPHGWPPSAFHPSLRSQAAGWAVG